ncbi:MAG: BON domain-containing protein [Pirellulaceae bacterium]
MNQGGNFNQQGGRNAARSTIRIPLRIGFSPKPVSTTVFTSKFENRITKLSGLSAIGPIRVTMDGSTAVLQGVVASEEDRQLAEGVALLEPEVDSVRNELTVQPSETGAGELNSPSNSR